MKLKNILTIALLATSLTSCFEDETTMGTGAISEILIDSTSIQKVYNINKNETLIITPVISQTNKEKDVTYTWEINLETYSHDQEFVYEGKELGSYFPANKRENYKKNIEGVNQKILDLLDKI